ncbi:MAG: BTAD domain-containing putative transcriptional regulator [Devosia sp.]
MLVGWRASQRHSLDARFRAFVGEASEQVACPAAEAALRRIADEHPYDDQACQGLMRYLARTGSREAALSVFDQFYKRVVDDLSAMPLPETLDLARSLRIFPRKTRRQSVTVGRVPVQTGPAPLPRVLIMAPSPEAVSAAVPIGRLLPIRALVEDVTLTLCRTREIAVLAPHTAAEAASAVSPQLATLEVDYAVWTSVLGTRRNPFLAAKVVRPESSEIVWFDSVSLGPLCAGEDRLHEAATWLGSAIAASIQRSELRLVGHEGRLAGYRHYLMGRRQLQEISLESVRRARKWFRLAAHLNPDFAAPHSWIAQSYVLEWMIFSHGTTDILESAVLSAQRAIEIDPQDPTGHRALGRAALFLHRYEDSLRFFSDAENFAPNHADILAEHADTLMHNSRPREAWQRIERALDLNPLAPDVYRWIAGGILFFNQRPLEALEQLRLMRRPDQAYRLMAACASSAGMSAAARTYARKAMENDPDFSLRTWTSRLPQRDRSTLNMYVDALKAAGFV